MARGVLVLAAMGGVFFVVPAILVIGSLIWIAARSMPAGDTESRRSRFVDAVRVAQDPLQIGIMLLVAGAALAGFVAGDLGAGTYWGIGVSTLRFLFESLTDWREAGTSESIALRGFAFIVIGSALMISFSLWRYLTRRATATRDPLSPRR